MTSSVLSHCGLQTRLSLPFFLVLAKLWVGWTSVWHQIKLLTPSQLNLLAVAHLVSWLRKGLDGGIRVSGVNGYILLSVMSDFQFWLWGYLLHLPESLLPLLYNGALTMPTSCVPAGSWLQRHIDESSSNPNYFPHFSPGGANLAVRCQHWLICVCSQAFPKVWQCQHPASVC